MRKKGSDNNVKTYPGMSLVLGGPTGIGKSVVAYLVAKEINGEVISADSRQFYREINIGTDKVPLWMRREVPHHLIDFLSLKDDFDVYSFAKLAQEKILEIKGRNRVPVIVGGSGLYLRSLIKGIFTIPDADRERQKEIRRKLEEKTTEALYAELLVVDSRLKESIHPNDRKRIRRALEVYYLTGRQMSFWQKQNSAPVLTEDRILYFILFRDRQEMYERIDKRVDKMFEDGWVDEVRQLKERGFSGYLRDKAPLGYVDILGYLEDSCTLEELKFRIKQKTRNFAKKQLTWFRRENGTWLQISGDGSNVIEEILLKFESDV